MENNINTIPKQFKGSHTDTGYYVDCIDEAEASELYTEAKNRLLKISEWHHYSGDGTADFNLTDTEGQLVSRLAQVSDHFKIDIPGPGSVTGDGFDWVKIEKIEESDDQTVVQVRPATNPTNQDSAIAHFFTDEASSTFIVKKVSLRILAEVHGRNEEANTKENSFIDKARNVLVATGAKLGLSEFQWKSLTKGLLEVKSTGA